MNVASSGQRGFADVIKSRILSWAVFPGLSKWALPVPTGVLGGEGGLTTEKESTVVADARGWAAGSEGGKGGRDAVGPAALEAGRVEKQILSRASRGVALTTPGLWPRETNFRAVTSKWQVCDHVL